jgi:hypothetical protein
MSAAAVTYFLFVIVMGQAQAGSLSTLASFHDLAACQSAAAAVTTAMQTGAKLASTFCVSTTDLGTFFKGVSPN